VAGVLISHPKFCGNLCLRFAAGEFISAETEYPDKANFWEAIFSIGLRTL